MGLYARHIHIMNTQDYIDASKKLQKASGWKFQTQKFLLNRLTEISALQKEVKSGEYNPSVGAIFHVRENGHDRLVKSMVPKDAVLQHAMCDGVIIPELKKFLIHDNGAGLKGKGLSFTRRRFEEHLRWHFRRYGTEGYVLVIDFSKYFDNIRHDKLLELFQKYLPKEITDIIAKILKNYEIDVSYSDNPNVDEEIFNSLENQKIPQELKTGKRMMKKSVGIGAPISQIAGIAFPMAIDTYIKTVKGIKCFDVYMDDRIIIHPDKQFLKDLLEEIKGIAKEWGIFINPRKTQIIKISHGFTWLKTRYILTESGKIIRKIPRDTIKRERRRLRKLAERVQEGEITEEEFLNLYKSWRGDKTRYNATHTLTDMDIFVRRLLCTNRQNEKRKS